MKLWLDDTRPPYMWGRLGWTWAKTAEEAIQYLQTGTVTEASFDHDLAWEHMPGHEWKWPQPMTGYDLCCWLEENPEYWPPDGVTVHSMNPVGRERMKQVIARHYGEGRSFMNTAL